MYHRFTHGDERRRVAWSAQDLWDAFALVSELPPDAFPAEVLMEPSCTVRDLFDDPSPEFLEHCEEVLLLLGAPGWCLDYAQEEALQMHDLPGSYLIQLRGSLRPERWTDDTVIDFLATMHLHARWTPSRCDLAALLWHMETMGSCQRALCQPIVDAAVRSILALGYECFCHPQVQRLVRTVLHAADLLGVLDRKHALKAFNLELTLASLEECGSEVLNRTEASEFGAGRWGLVLRFRYYMNDSPMLPALPALVHGGGDASRLISLYMAQRCTPQFGASPDIVRKSIMLRDIWVEAVRLRFLVLRWEVDARSMLQYLM
jgi:hypothetical protein